MRDDATLDREQLQQAPGVSETPLVLPLTALQAHMLPLVGGKAANLGELIRAGFSVPGGFCVTTAAYEMVSESTKLELTLAELASLRAEESVRLAELAATVRATLLQAPLPISCANAIASAYQVLGNGEPVPVAVRSSATAEDLPTASFAGQQETSLNIIGIESLLTAVRHCFASLWTERAVTYRASLGIDPRSVRLAVVVQRMVDAQVAGVLFTANPLTGKRRESVIEANPGLGEAVVSGATTPDYFIVNTPSGAIGERRLGDKRVVIRPIPGGGTEKINADAHAADACLSTTQVRALAELGAGVEAHFGSPQDIEWAIDSSGQILLLQARPITTLFPLPADAPSTDETLHAYLSFGIQQGTYRPFTPMGISALRLITSGFSAFVGLPLRDPLVGPRFVKEAACRLFFDVTGALRHSFGRPFLIQAMEDAELHAAESFLQLITDPRLSLVKTPRRTFGRALLLLLIRSRVPWYLLQALVSPSVATARVARLVSKLREADSLGEHADTATRLAAVEHLLFESPRLLLQVSPVMLAGMQTFALAQHLLGDLATVSECQTVLGGSPSNPTTRMNLALWSLSEQVRADPAISQLVQNTPAAQLAEDYRAGCLPFTLQQGLTRFLREYGHQGIAELDLGVPRWSEDPDTVLTSLVNYQQMHDLTHAPDAQFQRAGHAACAMVRTLSHRTAQHHWLRGWFVGFCLRRAHTLAGFREMPRFVVALVLAQVRALLLPLGEELFQAGRLSQADDIFFLSLPEVHAALAGADLRNQVSSQRAAYAQELTRHHVPLVLLSDGTEPTVQRKYTTPVEGVLQGAPASPGIVTGNARVLLDPCGATLSPGEILVAPTTDPGWTPLFLTAGGLVMEMGGTMAHGAIVAREYGIPAVVGVPEATRRISTGNRITVDGTAGTVIIAQTSA
ncbi:MAG: phosphoenolpyruvate synthase [Chloroflexi bacterium]|nr:phosphoenolpyruvate synthase [Chloroflexota bacterium]